MAGYTPKKGDFVSYYFSGQAGHEQSGRRPALVISNDQFNKKTGMAFLCPITNTDRNYPFHLPIPPGSKVSGVVMTDQVKAVDINSRKLTFMGNCPKNLVDDAVAIIDKIIN